MKYEWCVISDIFLEDICDLSLENEPEFDRGERLSIMLSKWMSL